MLDDKVVEIRSRDYSFIVEFLQQNWALIDKDLHGDGCTAFFFGDTAGVFDRLRFPSVTEAELALLRNGFNRYETDKKAQEFIGKPEPPFLERGIRTGRSIRRGDIGSSSLGPGCAGPGSCSTLKRIASSSIESRCAVARMRSSEASSVWSVPR